jgi:putative peptide zinc metalloprotease protein
LLGLSLAVLFVHEMGHALAVRHAGRRIVCAGFRLYLGHPAFFIDSSDLLLAPRRARAINALAGPYAEAVAAGVVSLTVWLAPNAPASSLLFRLAGLSYLAVLINLIPFIELDGYWLLSDILNVPRLRERAFGVLRYELPGRLRRRRASLSVAERMLVMFGIGAVVFPVAALVTAWTFWGPIAQRLFTVLWNGGPLGRLVLVLLLGLIAGPLAHVAGRAVPAAARWARRAADDLRFWAQTPWRVEAAAAVAALPAVGEIDDGYLADLAGRVTRRRVREGAVVVRQDEAAEAFYVVRRGRFDIVERDVDGGERLLRRAGPGDSFGELALLEYRPRTATVRAETDGELFVIDAGTFQRVLAPVMTTPELAPATRPALEVQALPPFRHLGHADAALLAERGEWILYGPGEIVGFGGDETADFYVLTAGQAEVLQDGARTAVLRAGDQFGVISLLRDVPRTATVRTITPARLFRIGGGTVRTLVPRAFPGAALPSAEGSQDATGGHS